MRVGGGSSEVASRPWVVTDDGGGLGAGGNLGGSGVWPLTVAPAEAASAAAIGVDGWAAIGPDGAPALACGTGGGIVVGLRREVVAPEVGSIGASRAGIDAVGGGPMVVRVTSGSGPRIGSWAGSTATRVLALASSPTWGRARCPR